MKKFLFSALLASLLVGCMFFSPDDIPEPPPGLDPPKIEKSLRDGTQKVSDSNSKVRSLASSSESSAIEIKKNVESGKKTNPRLEEWKEIISEAEEIEENSKEQKALLDKSDRAVEEMTELHYEIIKLQKYIEDVHESNKEIRKINDALTEQNKNIKTQLEDVENGAKAQNQKIWMTVIGFCALGLVAGVLLAIGGYKKIGIGLAACALFIAAIAYFMSAYAWLVAIAGGVVFFMFFGGVIYFLYVYRKSLIETVTTTEMIKHKEWNEAKEDINKFQSNMTKKLVSEIKVDNQI